MRASSQREKRLWSLAGLLLLLIYSSLYTARPVAEFLRQRGLLRAVVTAAFLLVVIPLLMALARNRPGWKTLAVLAVIAATYLAVLTPIELPEERLHFLEYGLVAGIVYAALRERRRVALGSQADWWSGALDLVPALGAIVLTGVAGWIDEGIQHLLPNRYYDLRDVAFNASAGAMVVLSILLVQWSRSGQGTEPETH